MQRTMKYARRSISAHGVSGLRPGMTIMEVMFAIMITTIGLLGAVSVFPVASEMARKGRLNDEVAICAETAVHKFDAEGMRRPDRWITWRFINGNWQVGFGPAMVVPGESYCLDPRFMAANLINNGSPPPAIIPNFGEATVFPAFPRRPNAGVTGPTFGQNDPDNSGNPGAPRMQRITLANGFPGSLPPYSPASFPMGRFQADYVFSFEDQLTYERPGVQKGAIARNDNALPAFQLYSPIVTNNGILPGKREDDGKLSWMLTLVPKIDKFSGTIEDKYVLSVVVFYARSPDLTLEGFAAPTKPFNEWTATILGNDFHSSGFGGGEVTITATGAGAAQKLSLRAGDWVMLSGLAPARNAAGNFITVSMYKWYRITDADEDPYEQPFGSGTWKRDVTLVGPDWDMQNILPLDSNGLPNPANSGFDNVEVTIVPNVVSVFDRTVRLELDGTGY